MGFGISSATLTEAATFLLVFAIGFICGKLFAAVQFSMMKSSAKGAARPEASARQNVDKLLRMGRRL
ncbi:hypothetical protein HYU17_04870 [Candidatus Woesearchaeota archaeon]|nr:hypothetical protein [Candidatus Woesearchaeota archaeon]